jgi:hypothetical protein
MWFIITFFTIAGILQLVAIVVFFISLIETIFKIEIFKENSWMDRILAKYILKPLTIIFLVMFGLLMIWRIMCFVLGHNC